MYCILLVVYLYIFLSLLKQLTMIESYLSYFSSTLLLIIGIVTILIIMNINKHEELSGLFIVAVFDAIVSFLSGLFVLIGIIQTINTCSLSHILLKHAMLLIPIINGPISNMSWNYHCWNTIKSRYKGKSKLKKTVLGTFPQLSISSLFLLGLFMFTPQNKNDAGNETRYHCSPSTMLSYTYTEQCQIEEFFNTSYYFDIFNKFLQDTNTTKYELLIFNNNKINMPNSSEEIIQKIYRLVEEETGKITNNRYNLRNTIPIKEVTSSFEDSDIVYNETSQSLNTVSYGEINDNGWFILIGNQSISNRTSKQNMNLTISPLKTLLCGSLSNQNATMKIQLSYCNNSQCHKKCFILNHDKKIYFIFLMFICYLIPSLGALVFYYKTVMQVIIETDENVRTRNDTLLRSSRWAMILPAFLLSPNFCCFFMEIIMCSKIPQWLIPVLTLINQVYYVLKNAFNVSVLKKCINNQIHPLIEEFQDETASSPSTTLDMQVNQ